MQGRIDGDLIADPEAVDIVVDIDDLAPELVTGNERETIPAQFAVDQMQVGAADPAFPDRDDHLAGRRGRVREIDDLDQSRGCHQCSSHQPPSGSGKSSKTINPRAEFPARNAS